MNMRSLQFSDASFDVVLDKGLVDFMLYMEDDEGAETDFEPVCREVDRVLAPAGLYVLVLLGREEGRRARLEGVEGLRWSVQGTARLSQATDTLEESHLYIVKKLR